MNLAKPFDETKGYIRQVFGSYWNYLRLYIQKYLRYSDTQRDHKIITSVVTLFKAEVYAVKLSDPGPNSSIYAYFS